MTHEADAIRVWFRLLRLQTRINLGITARVRELGLAARRISPRLHGRHAQIERHERLLVRSRAQPRVERASLRKLPFDTG